MAHLQARPGHPLAACIVSNMSSIGCSGRCPGSMSLGDDLLQHRMPYAPDGKDRRGNKITVVELGVRRREAGREADFNFGSRGNGSQQWGWKWAV